MTNNKMSPMEALSFPEGTRFIDGLGERLVRDGDGFFCEYCNVNHDARNLSLTSLKLEKEDHDEFMAFGLDTRFVHKDEDEDLWMYFSRDEEAEGHNGWIFGSDVETILRKARTGGYTWTDMTGIEIPDEGKNLYDKDKVLNFYRNGASLAVEQESEVEEAPSVEESLARIAKYLKKIVEEVK